MCSSITIRIYVVYGVLFMIYTTEPQHNWGSHCIDLGLIQAKYVTQNVRHTLFNNILPNVSPTSCQWKKVEKNFLHVCKTKEYFTKQWNITT